MRIFIEQLIGVIIMGAVIAIPLLLLGLLIWPFK